MKEIHDNIAEIENLLKNKSLLDGEAIDTITILLENIKKELFYWEECFEQSKLLMEKTQEIKNNLFFIDNAISNNDFTF